MHFAALNGQFPLVRYYIEECKMDPETLDDVRCTTQLVHTYVCVCVCMCVCVCVCVYVCVCVCGWVGVIYEEIQSRRHSILNCKVVLWHPSL